MKCLFIQTVLLCLLCCSLQAQTITPRADENVELMSILARLADFSEYNMNRAGEYDADIAGHFKEYSSHPAVLFMKEIRKHNSIAYDAVMSMAVHLEMRNGQFFLLSEDSNNLDNRWEKVDKAKFLSLLGDFYIDSRFHEFFEAHQQVYQRAIQIYTESILKKFDINWYSTFYGTPPEENYTIIIGFCNGGSNYGAVRHLKGERREIFV